MTVRHDRQAPAGIAFLRGQRCGCPDCEQRNRGRGSVYLPRRCIDTPAPRASPSSRSRPSSPPVPTSAASCRRCLTSSGPVTRGSTPASIAATRAWRAPGSPYEWVGYYLGAPCHSNTTWLGHRPFLASLGWGTAVLYVGQQTWDAVPAAAMVSPAAGRAAQSTTCSRTMLSGAQGTIDGSDAAAKAANEGFPAGTVIFLDIEYMRAVTQPMRDYYTSWVAQVLADGRYLPGVYCHTTNAPTIYADVHGEFLARRPGATPQFWITSGSGFSLDKAPTAVG